MSRLVFRRRHGAAATVPAAAALAALVLTPDPARSQAAFSQAAPLQAAPLQAAPALAPDGANSKGAKPAQEAASAAPARAVPQAGPATQGSAPGGETARQAARSADIFSRVPCLPPRGGVRPVGTLSHVAAKLASDKPVVIVAFGSSSTEGYGSSSPEFTYPSRLLKQLRRHYPSAEISMINAGRGGEDAPEMMNRLQSSVIDLHPDLVIWQVGTNAVLRNLDPDRTADMVEDGVARIQAAGSDVVLVDPQYSPRVTEHLESASRMVKLLGRVAELRHVGIFPRFEVMREWHEKQALPINDFVIADGLHMNDWGYSCFARLLGDDIIRSVGRTRIGVNAPSAVQARLPM